VTVWVCARGVRVVTWRACVYVRVRVRVWLNRVCLIIQFTLTKYQLMYSSELGETLWSNHILCKHLHTYAIARTLEHSHPHTQQHAHTTHTTLTQQHTHTEHNTDTPANTATQSNTHNTHTPLTLPDQDHLRYSNIHKLQ